jgi:hypothetical protein
VSKAETIYSEKERLVTLTQLNNFSLNCFAFHGMIETYIEHIHPLPVKVYWNHHKTDIIMDPRAPTKGIVEMWIYTAGYMGKKIGDASKLDKTFTNLFLQSYYEYQRPLPIDFVVYDAIGIHLRTPGVSDADKKNPLRDVFSQFGKLNKESPK